MSAGSDENGWNIARGLVWKALVLVGGALVIKRFTKSTTRWDHARIVTQSLCGEKFSREQAARDPENYFNLRQVHMQSEIWRNTRIFVITQRTRSHFLRKYATVKCIFNLQLESDHIDIAEHLTTIHLKRCDLGKRCLYEGSTPPGRYPNSWNGATYCTSELATLKNNEIHAWDRGYDDDGNQVRGVKEGPYEFKPAPRSNLNDALPPLNFPPPSSEKRIE